MVSEVTDTLNKLTDGGKGAATDRLLGDDVEPDLDLIEPGRVGRGEVDVIAGPSGEPAFDLGVLVGAVVVDDEVNVEVRGDVGVDVF